MATSPSLGSDQTSSDVDRRRERERVLAAQAGNQAAMAELVGALTPRVRAIARDHTNDRVSKEDLAQDGVVALIEAVQRFDVGRGIRLWTYAKPSVEGAIRRSARGGHSVSVPVSAAALMPKIKRTRELLRVRLGVEPTLKQLEAETDVPAWKIVELERVARGVLRLDELAGEDGVSEDADRTTGDTGNVFDIGDDGSDRYTPGAIELLIDQYAGLRSRVLGSRDEAAEGRSAPRSPGAWMHLRLLDLERALERLPEDNYVVIELMGLRQKRAEEVAEQLSLSKRTVYNRYSAGVNWLADYLSSPRDLPVLRSLSFAIDRPLDALAECVQRHRSLFERIAELERTGDTENLHVRWVAGKHTCVPVLARSDDGDPSRPLLEVLAELSAL